MNISVPVVATRWERAKSRSLKNGALRCTLRAFAIAAKPNVSGDN